MHLQDIHLNKQFDRWLTGLYAVKCFLEVINTAMLSRDAAKWMKKSRIEKSLGNVNRYKACSLHSVKYTLSALILLGEVILFINNIMGVLEYENLEEPANEHFHTIFSSNCSVYNSQTMVCAAYLGAICLPTAALTPVIISAILGTLVILTNFLITVYTHSEIDTNTVKNSFHMMFWRNLVIFTLISIQMTYVIGIIIAYSFIMYQLLFQLRRACLKLSHALIAKSNDPWNKPAERKYFKAQAYVYKRSVLVVFISVTPVMACFSVLYPKKGNI